MIRLSYRQIISAATWWKSQGGQMRVEVAALEPLLWSEGNKNIGNVVATLKKMGFIVSMTTNGSLLSKFVDVLSDAGIDYIRVSCHSFRPDIFRSIAGGGKLSVMLRGVEAAINSNILLSMNRTLLRGYVDDLEDHIRYVDNIGIRLKLLDLYWTIDSADEYDKFYISPEDALSGVSPSILLPIAPREGAHSRDRVRFNTPKGGIVEFKRKITAERDSVVCRTSSICSKCIEGYGEYFRIFPDGTYSLCYLRTDLASRCFDGDTFFIDEEQTASLRPRIGQIPLRFVLEGRCNFNCGFPGSKTSWCLKQGRGFIFPVRQLQG